MDSSRSTPNPSNNVNSGRPLTAADLQEYRQLFTAAKLHRPVSPTLPPSPPASPRGDASLTPESSFSSMKRKQDEMSSGEPVSSPNKRFRQLDYQIPPRIRHNTHIVPNEVATKHIQRATMYKRQADKDPRTMSSAVGAHFYAIAVLNFAFAYRIQRNNAWKQLIAITETTIDRFNKLNTREPNPKLDVWLSFMYLFKNSIEIQYDRDQINKFKIEIERQLRPPQQLPTVVAPNHPLPPKPAFLDSNGPSHSISSPYIGSTSNVPEGKFLLKDDQAKSLQDVLSRTRHGPHNGEARRRVLKHLNPAALRAHFPRTFMRTFSEYVMDPPYFQSEEQSPSNTGEGGGLLAIWEEHEIHDLEDNEREGGDFPYPHHPEEVFWVIVLGRSLLAELNLPESL
ncbi:hypothetical protein CPB86DRAFT_725418 [Serendipita vermifera]|nr:hypothetical protein CPB86DRAFT_725418 [Serendipita vermifera]